MENTKAILFDFDGVILDSEPLHFEAHKKALVQYGIDLTFDDYMNFGVSKGDNNLYEKVSQKYGIEIDRDAIDKTKKQIYKEIFDEKAELTPGILEKLDEFSKKYDLAVVSSGAGSSIKYAIEKLGIGKYFKVIVTGDDVERVKPFPDVYLKAIELLGLEKENCIAIEDSQTGLESAKNAGIKCIAIPNNFTKNQDFSKADVVLNNIKEIGDKLKCL